jgi:hypothetical protein
MHRTLVTFLHAVGLEAMRAADLQPPAAAASNPVRSSRSFVHLLRAMYRDEAYEEFQYTPEHAFFDMMFTCPLWAYFLNHSSHEAVEKRSNEDGRYDSDVLKFYEERCRRTSRIAEPVNRQVALRSPMPADEAAKFHGLHAILNTVPMQGDGEQRSRTRAGQSRATTGGAPQGRFPGNVRGNPPGGRSRSE